MTIADFADSWLWCEAIITGSYKPDPTNNPSDLADFQDSWRLLESTRASATPHLLRSCDAYQVALEELALAYGLSLAQLRDEL